MARKVAKRLTACPDCGGDLSGDAARCPSCGFDLASGDEPVAPYKSAYDYEDDDLPDRASHLFWFDALFFTRYWYIPVGILLLGVVLPVIAFIWATKNMALALIAAAIVSIFVLAFASRK